MFLLVLFELNAISSRPMSNQNPFGSFSFKTRNYSKGKSIFLWTFPKGTFILSKFTLFFLFLRKITEKCRMYVP